MYCTRFQARSSVRIKTMFGRFEVELPCDGAFWGLAGGTGVSAAVAEALPCPNLGFSALQATTTCGSTCGKDLLALLGRAAPCMIGSIQSTWSPLPSLTPPRTKPASSQAARICSHASRDAAATPLTEANPNPRTIVDSTWDRLAKIRSNRLIRTFREVEQSFISKRTPKTLSLTPLEKEFNHPPHGLLIVTAPGFPYAKW
jgi:hypothetical protein